MNVRYASQIKFLLYQALQRKTGVEHATTVLRYVSDAPNDISIVCATLEIIAVDVQVALRQEI